MSWAVSRRVWPSPLGARSMNSRILLTSSSDRSRTKVRDLSEDEVSKIREVIDRAPKGEGHTRRETAQDIKRKIEIGAYQGIRHRRSLPVRGQRTHTNARTRTGPRKTVAAQKKATQ